MNEKFLGIDHLGIAVNDLDAAIETYGNMLGFNILGTETLEDRGIKVCFVDTGNSKLELLGAIRDDSEISGFLEKRGQGIHHICIKVENIELAVKSMLGRGAKMAGGIQDGAHNTRVAFIHPKTTHGVLIELVEAS